MAQAARKSVRSVVGSAQRLEARVSAEQKALFQRAAALRGVSLTDFMVDSMREAAVKTMEEHELIRLAAEEREAFIEVLLNPPVPNKALRLATERYKKMIAR